MSTSTGLSSLSSHPLTSQSASQPAGGRRNRRRRGEQRNSRGNNRRKQQRDDGVVEVIKTLHETRERIIESVLGHVESLKRLAPDSSLLFDDSGTLYVSVVGKNLTVVVKDGYDVWKVSRILEAGLKAGAKTSVKKLF